MIRIITDHPVELPDSNIFSYKHIIYAKRGGYVRECFAYTKPRSKKSIFQLITLNGKIGVAVRDVIKIAGQDKGMG